MADHAARGDGKLELISFEIAGRFVDAIIPRGGRRPSRRAVGALPPSDHRLAA